MAYGYATDRVLEVSVVGWAANVGRRLDYDATSAVVDAALDAGVTFFDTADVYGGTKSEEYLGRALGRRRDDVVVATKFGSELDEHRRRDPSTCIERWRTALRLGTDRIDLYQLHTPDPDVPIEETARRPRRAGSGRQGARGRLLEFLGRPVARGGGGDAWAQRGSRAYRTSTAFCTAPQSKTFFPNASARASLSYLLSAGQRPAQGEVSPGSDTPEGYRLDSGGAKRLLTGRTLPSWRNSSSSRGRGLTLNSLAS